MKLIVKYGDPVVKSFWNSSCVDNQKEEYLERYGSQMKCLQKNKFC